MRKKRKLTKKQKETLELIVSIAVLVGFIALNLILGKDIFYVWYFAVIIMFAFEIAFSVYYIFTGKALFFKDEKKKKKNDNSPQINPKIKLTIRIGLSVILAFFTIVVSCCLLPNYFKDMPRIIAHEPDTARGYVQSTSSGYYRNPRRTLTVYDLDTKEYISIHIYRRGIQKGDYVEIEYYPNTMDGRIMYLLDGEKMGLPPLNYVVIEK